MATTEQLHIGLDTNSLVEIEEALTSVHARRGFDLSVSSTALNKRRGALRDAAFLQLLTTWARLSPDATLRLTGRADADTSPLLEEACGYSVGVGVLSIAPKIMVAGAAVSRPEALAPGASRMDAAFEGRYDELLKGQCVDLICVSGAQRQFLKPLFSRPASTAVKDKFGLKATVRGLAIKAHPDAIAHLDDSAIGAIATLTHELFENTQEHAVLDAQGKAYRRHVESLFVSWIRVADVESQNDLLANQTLREYWRALSDRQPLERQVAGLCFSFLDSGPGMAARLLKQDYVQMSILDEANALRDCLKLNVSTKDTEGTGSGFVEVLTEAATMNGLIRIRSGRLSIFRCFTPGQDHGALYEGFQDWYQDRPELMRVAGTLVSVFIPLPKVQG